MLQILQGVNTVGFAYDNAGRRSSMTLPGAITATYSYDSASRLASLVYSQATTSLGNLTYAYDANGNIIAKGGTLAGTVLPASVMSATYNAANELVHRDGNTFIYDANGNLLTDGGSTYTWDARNQLSTLAGPSMSSVFQYDGLGRRQAKAINSVQTNYLFDGANTVQEQGVDGSVVANVLTGLGVDQTLVRSDASGTNAFLVDALGSTLELVDGSGNLSSQCSYDPFGVSAASGPSSNTVQYAGRENDGTGLYYYRARYYNPKLGRFISEDPIGFSSGQTNLHAYVNDSPVNANDPSGLITGNVGVGGSGTFWGVSGNVFGGVVVDGYGNVGLYWGWGAGTGVGSGFSGGAQMGASTGTTIDDFGGPFYDAGLEGGVGSGYATDVYTGQGSDGSVVNGFTGTVGWGFGAGGWAGVTNTNIIPLGHLPFPQPSQPRPK